MPYKSAKIYYDGSHYIAIPKENFPSRSGKKKKQSKPTTKKQAFESAYKESKSLPRNERKEHIVNAIKDNFKSEEQVIEFVENNIERKKNNAIKRRVRLMRKIYLQEWNYFCTFTYSDELHTEESFKEKLRNTLKHFVSRNGWKYIGAFERSPVNNRLHFHGIFCIPKMVGVITEEKDYSTKTKRMQTTYQNSHFLKHFGRNDFKALPTSEDVIQSARYLIKYIEKSNERLCFGGNLPTYFISDILDDDIVCPIGNEDKKVLLFDNFNCWEDGCLIGTVSKETINELPKCN